VFAHPLGYATGHIVALKTRPAPPQPPAGVKVEAPPRALAVDARPAAGRTKNPITDVPPEIAAALVPRGITPDQVRVCTETDLDLQGNDALEWLVLTDDRLLTLAQVEREQPSTREAAHAAGVKRQGDAGTAVVLTELSYEGLKGARGDARVGSGMLEALPLTEPEHYVSIRHGHPRQREVGIIAHLSDLAPEQRRLVQETLRRRYISQIVLRINRIKQEFGLLEWDVETDRGRRQFSLPQSGAYVIEYGNLGEGRIVFDVYGNRYLIPNLHHLDRKSVGTFRRYVYW